MRREEAICFVANNHILGQGFLVRKFGHRLQRVADDRFKRVGHAVGSIDRRIGCVPIVDATHAALFPYLVGDVNDVLLGAIQIRVQNFSIAIRCY